MLQAFKNLQLDRLDVDDAIALFAFGQGLADTYAAHDVDKPEWLGTNLEALSAEIKQRVRDTRKAKLKAAEARMETFKTPSERKAATAAEIKKLKAQLSA